MEFWILSWAYIIGLDQIDGIYNKQVSSRKIGK